MSLLSIQSHVVYGCVGNRAAVYPLQSMGYDVWPINTVQFSNHTGYGKWRGEILGGKQILDLVQGIEDINQSQRCEAALSGYMGSADICDATRQIVNKYKSMNPNFIYLCDPVIGSAKCYVDSKVLDFYKQNLRADIITPDQHEAEILSDTKIVDVDSLKAALRYFHEMGIGIVVVTGVKIAADGLLVFVSNGKEIRAANVERYDCPMMSGAGDLFSALYLGHYLKSKDAFIALRQALYFTQKVLRNTYESGERELQILSVNYRQEDPDELPSLMNV